MNIKFLLIGGAAGSAIGLILAGSLGDNYIGIGATLFMAGLVALLVAGVISVIRLIKSQQLSPEEKAIRDAERAEYAAKKAVAKDALQALADYRKTVSAHEKQTASALSELSKLLDARGARVASKSGTTIYERRIVTPDSEGSINGVHATFEDNTSISQRLTLTRFALIGVFSLFTPKKSSRGHAYVVFEGPEIGGVIEFPASGNSNAGPEAARFAQKINATARAAAQWELERPALEKQMRAEIDRLAKIDVGAKEREIYTQKLSKVDPEFVAKYKLTPIN